MAQPFCLDTSFLINGWSKRYRIDVFPSLWEKLESLIRDGKLCACRAVFDEINEQDDGLTAWACKHEEIFHKPNTATLKAMRDVMKHCPNFAAVGGAKNKADPWVISHGIAMSGVIVTDENPAPKQRDTKPPKIPDACDKVGLSWMTPIQFLATIGLRL
jgi:Domain of unknown function (DUF4411)